jgi:hypothetical protein
MTKTEIHKYLKNPGLLDKSTLSAIEVLIHDYPAFETGWLLWLRNLKNIQHDEFNSKIAEAAIRISNRKGLKKFLDSNIPEPADPEIQKNYLLIPDYSAEIDSAELPESFHNQGTKMGLIESFLSGSKDFKVKNTDQNVAYPENIADRSVLENDDMLTETYANILLSQGKLEKALLAFEKLSLKFPEKSIYFAARIEEVKLKLNR